ncbi:MAG: hypothetical protein ACRD2J_09780, partial [Thermoanaerobaculia bacterium]
MNCESFRERIAAGVDDAAVRAHLRSCEACLEYAMGIDPDVLFRSLGVPAEEPPGGIDAFAAEVMQQVRLRDTERQMVPRARLTRLARWSAAAALA